MKSLVRLLSFAMAFVLLITSGAMANARGQMVTATGVMVLCTGTGPEKVLVDADGQPVHPGHICPDCVVGAMDLPVATTGVNVPVRRVTPITVVWGQNPVAEQRPSTAVARGPPAL